MIALENLKLLPGWRFLSDWQVHWPVDIIWTETREFYWVLHHQEAPHFFEELFVSLLGLLQYFLSQLGRHRVVLPFGRGSLVANASAISALLQTAGLIVATRYT